MKVFPHEIPSLLEIISVVTPGARHTLKVLSRPFGCNIKTGYLIYYPYCLALSFHIYNSEAPALSTTGLVCAHSPQHP